MGSLLPLDASILVVDDETFALKMAVRILNSLGYTCIATASDGHQALQTIQANEQPFELVLCDLNMPQMDGVELMHKLLEIGFEGGLVLISGEDERILDTALGHVLTQNLNVLGAIAKPILPEALDRMLCRYRRKVEQRQYRPETSLQLEELRAGIAGSPDSHPVLVFQPKIEIRTGKVSGVETLARWHHAERGLLGPGAFIPLAEDSGLIDELTQLIYRQAVEQTAQWHRQGIYLATSVNISVNSFSTPGFAEFLVSTAEEVGVHPAYLILEATETQVMENAFNCTEILMRLRMKKFGLSIDDFGTGNASLSQLMKIPFSEMKIDRCFINRASSNDSARAIVETSVALAKRLRMSIVAEGAETREDWDLVEEVGCDYLQGFYCGKPMHNGELMAYIAQWSGPH
ncbi:MAG: EAL domain-containing response regulator [Pseudomonadales bacterium]|nr:EAL domain-containing response regulator [Pseudomonadales bacterium]MCP5344296.1 EAL domain-containing response regulator [Pseudomonadales bacterium]